MKTVITKQLIFDYFSGAATALQKQQIDEWCQTLANEEIFYEWLEEWESTHVQYLFDEKSASRQYNTFLHTGAQSSTEPAITPLRKSWRTGWGWALAASIGLVMGFWLLSDGLLHQTYTTGYGQTRSITLPDGSQVTLNANSSLTLPRFGFGGQSRKVDIRGEAAFSVVHTPDDKQFVVRTPHELNVIVLGTEFTVFARPRGANVVLNRGKVQLEYHRKGQTERRLTMQPGDLIALTAQGKLERKRIHQPEHYAAWRENRYVFDETSLREIALLFKENYGITVHISDAQTAQLTLSGSFPVKNAEELLSIIAEALNIRVSRSGKTIVFSAADLTQLNPGNNLLP